AKGSVWYLVAGVEGELRTYRVSRIHAARLTGEPGVRPADFNLAAYWQQTSTEFVANLPQYHALLRVAPGVLPRLRYMMRYTHLGPPDPADAAGWVTLSVQFQMEGD